MAATLVKATTDFYEGGDVWNLAMILLPSQAALQISDCTGAPAGTDALLLNVYDTAGEALAYTRTSSITAISGGGNFSNTTLADSWWTGPPPGYNFRDRVQTSLFTTVAQGGHTYIFEYTISTTIHGPVVGVYYWNCVPVRGA